MSMYICLIAKFSFCFIPKLLHPPLQHLKERLINDLFSGKPLVEDHSRRFKPFYVKCTVRPRTVVPCEELIDGPEVFDLLLEYVMELLQLTIGFPGKSDSNVRA